MFAFLLAAASLTPAVNDISYTDLGYTKPATPGHACIARFDGGTVEITQAFNTAARTSINTVVVTGATSRTVPVGSRVWVKAGYGPAWRGLVLSSSSGRIAIAAHHRFVGDLFISDSLTVEMYDRLDASSRDATWVRVGTSDAGFREKLAKIVDCAESIGI